MRQSIYRAFLVTVFLLLIGSVSPAFAAVSNTITITDKSGAISTNYPFQFGRPFIQGEIKNYPQVLINGTAATTQADVKNRWPDGSVKFAVIAVTVPTIPANGTVTLSFQNQSSGNNTALTSAQMLDSAYNFDAQIKLTSSGTTKSASARTMLQNGDCKPWTQGQIAQTVLCADDSTSAKYDVGFDSYKPFRPRFYVTFWPGTHQVTVRYVGEDSLVGSMEDMQYDLSLTLGNSAPQTVYTRANLIQPFLSRWTKTYWIGGTPEQKINIDNNLGYLEGTTYFPNYDPSMKVPESTLAQMWTSWQSRPHDLYDAGFWTKYMPTTGARSDIGIIPTWTVQWIYSGDWRARTIALGQSDLAGSWGLHAREGNPAKKIDKAQTISGIGLPISEYAYPTTWFPDNNGGFARMTATPTHTIKTGTDYPGTAYGWVVDGAHQPDPFYSQYVLTGDYFYLEESQLWAGTMSLGYARGYTGNTAGINDQIRGNAWVFRNRANTAFITPDSDTTQKQFFTDLTNDTLAFWEGKVNMADGAFVGTPEYQAGQRTFPLNTTSNPDYVHAFGCQTGQVSGVAPTSVNYCEQSQWEHYYWIAVLGMETERGFNSGPFFSWLSVMLTSQFADPGYNPFNMGGYWVAIGDGSGTYYPTWAKIQQVNVALGTMNATTSAIPGDPTYFALAAAAGSFTTALPGGGTAWDWLVANVRSKAVAASFYNGSGEIQWNILPRVIGVHIPYVVPTGPVASPTSTPPVAPAPTATSTPSPTPSPVIDTSICTQGTAGNDALTANVSVHCINGAGGTDTLKLSYPTNAPGSWFKQTKNTDGSITLQDVHATGYVILLQNIRSVTFPNGEILVINAGGPAPIPAHPVPSTPVACSKGTGGNDTLSADASTHCIDGAGGSDTVVLTYPSGAPASWFGITKNTDGSTKLVDNHATGYTLTLYGISSVVFPNKEKRTLNTTDVTNSSALAAPSVQLIASPATSESGRSVSLTWTSSNVSSCTPSWYQGWGLSGSVTVTPTQTTTYHISCTGPQGSATSDATVTVSSPSPSLPWAAAADVVIATSSDATIVAGPGIHYVEAIGGSNNTVVLTQPGVYANSPWYKITNASDGSITVQDTHATGYTVHLFGIQKIIFPAKDSKVLSMNTSPLVHTLALGWTGPEVVALQSMLQQTGHFTLEPTGYFGQVTESSVKEIQQENNLAAIGIVGPQTRALILKLLGR